MYSNVYANCVGYSFEQSYSSNIDITRETHTDDDCLQDLKALATEYNMALEIVDDNIPLIHPVDDELIQKVLLATTLQDCYK